MATCNYCDEPIIPDAAWPFNGLHTEGIDIHDGCYDMHQRESSKAFRARIETLPLLSRVGRENAAGGTRVTGRPVDCLCSMTAEIDCPVHGAWLG